jgi:hypothetical protein
MNRAPSPFVDAGVDPLLTELPVPILARHVGQIHPQRARLQAFIREDFRQAHGAEVYSFYPNLLSFTACGAQRAVVGYRDPRQSPLFAEQYLDRPAHELAGEHLGMDIRREQMVEVGNLALADPGQARWVIAASTAFLAAAGYRWVLFTANRPLANAFQRLGLKPLFLDRADPSRLPDRGAAWGSYYDNGPKVYVGDIQAGCHKLLDISRQRRPNLHTLLQASQHLGVQAGLAAFDYEELRASA